MPVSGLPVSPSVARQAALFGKQVSIGPSGLVNSLLPPHHPMPDPKDSHDREEFQEVNNTNQDNDLGTTEKAGQPPSTVESGKGSGPPDKAPYKRFNGKEQKEREKRAESWIPAEVKKRVYSNRKASLPPNLPVRIRHVHKRPLFHKNH